LKASISGYLAVFSNIIGGSEMSILSLVIVLIVAALCSYLAQRLVPSTVSGGHVTTTIVGVVGAYIGSSVIGAYGPDFYGVSLIPSLLGAAVSVFATSLLYRALHKSS
jgi:uncharacterized membrane protein YeaQ/YmgE (transglycosylase-associated protein family)